MTTQGLPEHSQGKIDPNFLPPESPPKKASRLLIGFVIVVVVLACLPWPFLTMKKGMAAGDPCDQVRDELDACNAQLASIEDEYESFLNLSYTWSIIMDDVQQIPKGSGGALGNISQSGSNISIDGEFVKENYVYQYAIMLNETEHFSQVNINSITEVASEGGDVYRFDILAVLKGGL